MGGGYRNALYIEVPSTTTVLGVECDKESVGGILAELANDVHSDRDWMCTVDPQATDDWKTVRSLIPTHFCVVQYLTILKFPLIG